MAPPMTSSPRFGSMMCNGYMFMPPNGIPASPMLSMTSHTDAMTYHMQLAAQSQLLRNSGHLFPNGSFRSQFPFHGLPAMLPLSGPKGIDSKTFTANSEVTNPDIVRRRCHSPGSMESRSPASSPEQTTAPHEARDRCSPYFTGKYFMKRNAK